MNFNCELNFPLKSKRHAEIVFNTLRIDKEPKKTVQRLETLNENVLNVRFQADEAKFIRVAVESYIEKLNLILRTIQRFDPNMKFFILFFFISLSFSFNYEDFKLIENEQELNVFIEKSTYNVVVFVDKNKCKNDTDEKCQEERLQLEKIRNLCQNENIQFALSTNTFIAEKQFNIYSSLPKLCYFRDGFPIIYSGSFSNLDEIHEWFNEVRERLTHSLNDKTFEHDTQASTGSTTGDWFILFKKSNESRNLIPLWESTSFQFRNRAIFAYVDVDKNPQIQKRFHIFHFPAFILFKRGKMYRYENSSWKQKSFSDFIENDYKNLKGELVPPESSFFSFKISIYLIIVPMICLSAILLVLVLVSGLTKKKKTTNERIPFQVKID